jgi:hypothetical protein
MIHALFFALRHPILALKLVGIGLMVGAHEAAAKLPLPWEGSTRLDGALFEISADLDFLKCRRCRAIHLRLLGWQTDGALMTCWRCSQDPLISPVNNPGPECPPF